MDITKEDMMDKIRRSLGQEFVRLEDDFDTSRDHRKKITNKLMSAVDNLELADDKGELRADIDDRLKIVNTALKALSDAENAQAKAIGLKLKNQELEQSSSAASADRIAIILKATAPGAIREIELDPGLEDALEEMYGAEIKEFELKTNPRDISE